MFNFSFVSHYLKSKSFVIVLIFAIGLFVIRFFLFQQELSQVKALYRTEQDAKVIDLSSNLEEKLKMSYETLRTISLLPGVRAIEEPGTELSPDVKSAIQQMYNNIFVNIRVSEIYVLPKDFDFMKINPKTKKPQEPLAVFDELITGNSEVKKEEVKTEDKNKLEEVEEFEYALHKEQLKYLAEKYPTNSSFEKLEVPMVSGPEVITCDNAEFSKEDLAKKNDNGRKGIVFTVPKYSPSGKLNGAISAVLRTNVIKALIPEKSYGLINKEARNQIIRNPSKDWLDSMKFFEEGKNNPNLIYSKVLNLKTNDKSSWHLWIAIPDSEFYQTINYKNALDHFIIEVIIAFLIILSLLRLTLSNFQKNFTISDVIHSLQGSSGNQNEMAKELKSASQAIVSSTEQQSAMTYQVAASVEEISAMAEKSKETIRFLMDISKDSIETSHSSADNITKLADAIASIENSEKLILKQVESNEVQLSNILTFINEIKNKTKLIDDIVFQTKLLSFNASVEAARAGEQGKGFAVVAEEVGKLAASSGMASHEINDMLSGGIEKFEAHLKDNSQKINALISDSSIKLENGKQLSSKCVLQLKGMNKISEEIKSKISETEVAIKEQALALNEISKATAEFHLSIDENRLKCQNVSKIVTDISTNSEEVQSAVINLNRLVK